MENGKFSYSAGSEFGDAVKHSCKEGYEFEACDDCTDTQTCKVDGWSGKIPACKSMYYHSPIFVLGIFFQKRVLSV